MFKERLEPERLGKAYSGQDLTAVAPSDDQVTDMTAEESNQAANSSSTKRKRDAEDCVGSTTPKKQKSTSENPSMRQSNTSGAEYISLPVPEQLCTADVQLAFYALERLRAAWNITHTTGILLLDTQLQLWYYDSQGAIQSHYIDILQQLPLFVVMVMIFQRFNRRMWGVRETEISCAEGSKTYHIIKDAECGPHFGICGRRPFTAHVSDRPEDLCVREDSSKGNPRKKRG
ncbi:hypothetical protein MPER_03124, partial [Moniliophthora perniciosa FA553]